MRGRLQAVVLTGVPPPTCGKRIRYAAPPEDWSRDGAGAGRGRRKAAATATSTPLAQSRSSTAPVTGSATRGVSASSVSPLGPATTKQCFCYSSSRRRALLRVIGRAGDSRAAARHLRLGIQIRTAVMVADISTTAYSRLDFLKYKGLAWQALIYDIEPSARVAPTSTRRRVASARSGGKNYNEPLLLQPRAIAAR